MAQFLDDYNILDLHDLLYTGHTCVLFLEPDQEERGDAKEAGKTAAAAVGISASITTMATDCVVI
jgi:hypothetical protein